ncbi:hypothetical protein [Pseudoalteromonas sp. Of11M-6]|uniref:hypothetical protein n=1 Tax=Pseudoalteromonas sp. Of11M-6 TaxID=2917754 RepID=UPI001EF3F08A|nr:hypothetical protein [Pseudoalteromonas sp. Of11M-6]MCG7551970.1 hypothetical protein [Pseudoalteromonas sp. Of11M-6]
MSNFFKKYWKTLIFSAGAYLLWVIFCLIYVKFLFPDVMTHLKDDSWKPSDFAISYAASATDSLIFFAVVGLAITLISLRKPEEEKLATKIEFIFPGADPESTLGKFLANRISALACVSPVTKRVIAIQEISEANDAVKVLSKNDCIIKNIHNNHEYATDSMSFGITADEVNIDSDIIGEVNDIKILFDLEDPSKNRHILNGTQALTNSNREFKETFSLSLEPGQVVNYQTSAWLWQPLKESIRLSPPRFTESQQISLYNNTQHVIEFRVGIPNDEDLTFQVQPGRKHEFEVSCCSPGEKVIIHFEKWQLPD